MTKAISDMANSPFSKMRAKSIAISIQRAPCAPLGVVKRLIVGMQRVSAKLGVAQATQSLINLRVGRRSGRLTATCDDGDSGASLRCFWANSLVMGCEKYLVTPVDPHFDIPTGGKAHLAVPNDLPMPMPMPMPMSVSVVAAITRHPIGRLHGMV
ncbi:MAG: hypothetical protein K2Q97_16580 [Burkholderiaceae bacterium]|nr:hypothetical protein [Burkholderiaceae bacterium]